MHDPRAVRSTETLRTADIHEQWEDTYLSAENEPFFEEAFDYIADVLAAPDQAQILDAGCGPCAHAIRLVRRGFRVRATDISYAVLRKARQNVHAARVDDKVTLQQANILDLPFRDGTFPYVLCWGVLMHVPAIERAITELARVTQAGGVLVIGENNAHSLQSVLFRAVRTVRRRPHVTTRETPAGIEYWTETPSGLILYREANVVWLVEQFEREGFVVRDHVARQFTEVYWKLPASLRKAVHGLNSVWFRSVQAPRPSHGNLLFLQKEGPPSL